jgi:hypothetical protein
MHWNKGKAPGIRKVKREKEKRKESKTNLKREN